MKPVWISEKIAYFDQRGPEWDLIVGNDEERRAKIRAVFDSIDLAKGDTVLDAGCGNGVLFDFIEEKMGAAGRLVAVDAAPSMIQRARELYPDYGNIEFRVGMLESLLLEDSFFDAVLCFSILPHVDDLPKVLSRFKKSLKAGGKLYIFHLSDTRSLNAFHGGLDGPVKHDLLPEKDEMLSLLEAAGFTVRDYIDRTGLNFIECLA
ncbi:MAG TPA: class I SAM-dependent methyltransferase [Spirochaetes bacterium]|nr:class I SAM-dependent methyltransferase [Spirochaetota bacterium]